MSYFFRILFMKTYLAAALIVCLSSSLIFASEEIISKNCVRSKELSSEACMSLIRLIFNTDAKDPAAEVPAFYEDESSSIRLHYRTDWEGENWAVPDFKIHVRRTLIDQIKGYGRIESFVESSSKYGHDISHEVKISSVYPARTDKYSFTTGKTSVTFRSDFRIPITNKDTFGPGLKRSLIRASKPGKTTKKYLIPCQYYTTSLPGHPDITNCIGDIDGQPVTVMRQTRKGLQPFATLMLLEKYEVNIKFPDGHFLAPQVRTPRSVLP